MLQLHKRMMKKVDLVTGLLHEVAVLAFGGGWDTNYIHSLGFIALLPFGCSDVFRLGYFH